MMGVLARIVPDIQQHRFELFRYLRLAPSSTGLLDRAVVSFYPEKREHLVLSLPPVPIITELDKSLSFPFLSLRENASLTRVRIAVSIGPTEVVGFIGEQPVFCGSRTVT